MKYFFSRSRKENGLKKLCQLTGTLNEISDQELILEKIGCRSNYESSIKSIRKYVWTTFIILMFFITYDFYSSTYHDGESVLNRFQISQERQYEWHFFFSFFPRRISFRWFFWTSSLVAQIMDLTILVVLVGWLGLKFSAINEKISSVVARANASSPKVLLYR